MTTRLEPLAALPHTAAVHFRLHFYGAVLLLRDRAGLDETTAPGLAGYLDELRAAHADDPGEWDDRVDRWGRDAPTRLPLAVLADHLGLSAAGVRAVFLAGLVEEDIRFGAVFAALQGAGATHPGMGLLASWLPGDDLPAQLGRARGAGLVRVDTPPGVVAVEQPVWDALRGLRAAAPAPWLRWTSPGDAPPMERLVLPPADSRRVSRLAELLDGESRTVVVRGPRSSGRRTMLAAAAARAGRGLLHVDAAAMQDDRWRMVGALATLHGAVPVVAVHPEPGGATEIPDLPGYRGPLAVVAGPHGGVRGRGVDGALRIDSTMPDPECRAAHWADALPGDEHRALRAATAGMRMTGGNIRRVAAMARAEATLDGTSVQARHLHAAVHTLHTGALEQLAQPLVNAGDWDSLAVADEVMGELRLLETRCRARETLRDAGGAALRRTLGVGVRALFSGPSGTGKTLAAQVLATRVGVCMHRVDLASLVSKYIGETEKNLATLFARAEETDAALLIDEGDALMARRTQVQNANDRYANLETNYLLQRLESFQGILVVTTNAADRIDTAFRRRFDVVVEFPTPEPAERLRIWRMHLDGDGAVDALLEEVAGRCALTGGQIRNAALHATLLCVGGVEPDPARAVVAAVRREYRACGGVCPLPADGGV